LGISINEFNRAIIVCERIEFADGLAVGFDFGCVGELKLRIPDYILVLDTIHRKKATRYIVQSWQLQP
jgi:hypothetical protein